MEQEGEEMKQKISDAKSFEAFKLMVLQIGEVYKGGRWRNALRARRMLRKAAKA